ncbi:MAG TPA: ABC transporter substrate-binding protein, partial [Fervidobacterium nodosum]|nr:ABC transporter substrate-binding protein [Fervidobacterium nodosum]
MRKLLSVLLFLGLFVSIFAEVGVYNDKVVIGTFQALSGPYAVIGQEMTKGMKAYFNWVNNRGGVYGRKIELIVADDQLNPAKTVVEVKRLVEQDKVFAIVGGLGTYGCL